MFPTRPSARDLFEILVREHADMLLAFLRSILRRGDLVDDVFQETLIVAWRRLGDYDRSRPFGPWLRGIGARVAMAAARRAGRFACATDPHVLAELEGRFAGLDRRAGDTFEERAGRLRTCLDRLPAAMREAIDLAYGRGMRLAEIAASIEATQEAVKKRVQRARALLADCLAGSEEPA